MIHRNHFNKPLKTWHRLSGKRELKSQVMVTAHQLERWELKTPSVGENAEE